MTSSPRRHAPFLIVVVALMALMLAGSAQAAGHVWIESTVGNVDEVLGFASPPTFIVHNDTDTALTLKTFDQIPDLIFPVSAIACLSPIAAHTQCDLQPNWAGTGAYSGTGVFESTYETPTKTVMASDPLPWNVALHVFSPSPGSFTVAQQAVGTAGPTYDVTVRIGTFPLTFAQPTLTGANPNDFVITKDSCLGPEPSLTTCDVAVSFFPQATGTRTATLSLASTGTYADARTVSLTGTAVPAPVPLKGDKGDTGSQGIQGIQGVQGIQGPKGDTGLQGPPGQIACRDTVVARAACSITFAAGTWKVASTTVHYTVSRAGHVVARGTRRAQRHLQIRLPRKLRAGRYLVEVRVGDTILRQSVKVV